MESENFFIFIYYSILFKINDDETSAVFFAGTLNNVMWIDEIFAG